MFFEQQKNPEVHHMVAFGAKDPSDEKAFTQKWTSGFFCCSKKTGMSLWVAGRRETSIIESEGNGI
jgi:hypothetical protein